MKAEGQNRVMELKQSCDEQYRHSFTTMIQYVQVPSSVNGGTIFERVVVLKVREDMSKPDTTVSDIVMLAVPIS